MITYADDFSRLLFQTYRHSTAKISVNGYPINEIRTLNNGNLEIYSEELENIIRNLKAQVELQKKFNLLSIENNNLENEN